MLKPKMCQLLIQMNTFYNSMGLNFHLKSGSIVTKLLVVRYPNLKL